MLQHFRRCIGTLLQMASSQLVRLLAASPDAQLQGGQVLHQDLCSPHSPPHGL